MLHDAALDDADGDPLARLVAAAKFRNQFAEDPDFRANHPEAYGSLGAVEMQGKDYLEILAASQQDIEEMQRLLQ